MKRYYKSSKYKTVDALEKAYKKNAKVLNTRIKALEENNYSNTKMYMEISRQKQYKQNNKNRFSQGTKQFKNIEELKKANDYIVSLLQDEKTTLKGQNKAFTKLARNLVKNDASETNEKRQFFDDAFFKNNNYTDTQKKILLKEQIKTANKRLKQLEKNNIQNEYTQKVIKSNMIEGNKKINQIKYNSKLKGDDLNYMLKQVSQFNQARGTDTKKVIEQRKKTIETFRKKGLEINKKDENNFFNFLSSGVFNSMKEVYDSEQLIDEGREYMEKSLSVEDLQKKFEEYYNTQLTSEQASKKVHTYMQQKIRRKHKNK